MKNPKLGVDIALEGSVSLLCAAGDIQTTGTQDVALVDDLAVVRQALGKRLNTRKGDLWSHPDYGCGLWDRVSELLSDTWFMQATAAVRECINDDPRTEVVSVNYEAAQEDRQVTFTVVYRVADGRQDNLVWSYAPEEVNRSV
jgi:phage baseplate assembly protein W